MGDFNLLFSRLKREFHYKNFSFGYLLLFSNSYVSGKNLIYLFIAPSQTGLHQRHGFLVVESRSIFYSSKVIYLQFGWFTGYNGIMIEH